VKPETPFPVHRYFTTEAQDRRSMSPSGYPLPVSRPGSRPTSSGGKSRSSKELDRYNAPTTPTRMAPAQPAPEVRSRPRFSFSGLQNFTQVRASAAAPSYDPYLLSQARSAVTGRRNYLTAKHGDALYDHDGYEAGAYNLPRDHELVRVRVTDVRGRRGLPDTRRLNSVLTAMKNEIPLMPVKVDRLYVIHDGFHRLQASKLLGLEYIYVQKQR
jgi:hypothetical protein